MTHLARFARLFVMAAVPGLLALAAGGSPITVGAGMAVGVAALETAWRVVFPTVPANTAVPPAPSAPTSSTVTFTDPLRPQTLTDPPRPR